VKTGDQAVYKSRNQHAATTSKSSSNYNSDEDAMYDKVDRYHNRKEEEDHIRLEDDPRMSEDDDDDDDGITKKENVLDLGAAMDDSDSDSEDSDSDSEDDNSKDDDDDENDTSDEGEQELSSSDEEEDLEDLKEDNVRDWGRNVYGGDTADLEIGQEDEDAYLEEEAAKEVQAARYKDMKEDDFMLDFDPEDDDEDDDDKTDDPTNHKKRTTSKGSSKVSSSEDILLPSATSRDVSKLSRSDKRRLLKSHHPELLPLMSHFSEVIQEWNTKTRVVANALLDGEDPETPEAVGATPMGLQYLVTKSTLQTSVALNVAMYLLLKSEQQSSGGLDGIVEDDGGGADMLDIGGTPEEGTSIESHPIMARLKQWNTMAEKLEDKVESKIDTLSHQMDNLVKASALLKSGSDDDGDDDDQQVDESDAEHGGSTPVSDVDQALMEESPARSSSQTAMADGGSSSEDDEEDEQDLAKGVLNEARFGLRPQEIDSSTKKKNKKKRVRRAMPSEFGDDEDDRDADKKRKATLSLASTVNAIEQRSQSRKRRSVPNVEDVDDTNEDEEALRQGLEMMEAELGAVESDDGGEDDNGDDDGMDDELDDGLDDGFYEQVKKSSKAKKAMKKSMYEVAPKYPGLDGEVEGERAISRAIMKNRGLVAHKNKLNRNPRVKKREQYRKAVIRRKGAVREVRTEEGHKYGGETTGIKSGLSRSRKLGVR